MRIFRKLHWVYLVASLIILVISSLTFRASVKLLGADNPILTKEEAISVAVDYLAKNNITVDASTADATFFKGNWRVMFFINPSERPGTILISINPITGESARIPLK
ncbi:MAG TPA: hypothetical protein VFO91_06655 [Anaerolineales bacterium]|nr:hypothetical protein [Anaerolineales bacterium]